MSGGMLLASASPSSPDVAAATAYPLRSRNLRITCTSLALSSMTTIRSGVDIDHESQMHVFDQPGKCSCRLSVVSVGRVGTTDNQQPTTVCYPPAVEIDRRSRQSGKRVREKP